VSRAHPVSAAADRQLGGERGELFVRPEAEAAPEPSEAALHTSLRRSEGPSDLACRQSLAAELHQHLIGRVQGRLGPPFGEDAASFLREQGDQGAGPRSLLPCGREMVRRVPFEDEPRSHVARAIDG
jgi:hypothetical protein